jgi:hypothetical protein
MAPVEEMMLKHVANSHSMVALRRIVVGVALLSGLAAQGCAIEGTDDDVGREQAEIVAPNGMSINGMSLNGMSINGMSLNGMSLNGMSLNGMSLNGMSLNGMSINGTELTGVTGDGPVSGTALVGATMVGQLSNGDSLSLRVDAAGALAAPNADVWAYEVSVDTDSGWQPLCGTDAGGTPIGAIPLAGTWNAQAGVPGGGSWTASSSLFSLGCRGASLAKCVEFGYKPWQTVGGASLRDHHQACTRMLRADYCGDGASWTANGTPINLYDDLGIQSDDAAWLVDAEWTANGAICTNNIRDFQPGSPTCVEDLHDPDCGADFSGGALVINEYGQ